MIDPYRGKDQGEVSAGPDLIAPFLLARAAMKHNTAKAIASQTGGEYQTFKTRDGFEIHMIDFTNHLHSRYMLTFQPRNPQPGLHRITVCLAEPGDAKVLARTSYRAEGGAQ